MEDFAGVGDRVFGSTGFAMGAYADFAAVSEKAGLTTIPPELSYAEAAGMELRYIQPGKPSQNAYIERFNRTYREELLDQHLFGSLEAVREATWWWMLEYNEHRPHDALGDRTPNDLRQLAGKLSTYQLSA